jgi:hypothetical protein
MHLIFHECEIVHFCKFFLSQFDRTLYFVYISTVHIYMKYFVRVYYERRVIVNVINCFVIVSICVFLPGGNIVVDGNLCSVSTESGFKVRFLEKKFSDNIKEKQDDNEDPLVKNLVIIIINSKKEFIFDVKMIGAGSHPSSDPSDLNIARSNSRRRIESINLTLFYCLCRCAELVQFF